MSAPLLELRDLHAGYGGVEVLHGIDLVVPAGSVVGLLGANGAGKTTTLRVAAGLMAPTRGQLLLDGHDVRGASAQELARCGLCLIPEGRAIFPNLSVAENLLMGTYLTKNRSLSDIEAMVCQWFPVLGIRRDQRAGTLSGGEQQMLALSRALATDPALLLLDELSMGLAPLVVQELFGVVRRLAESGGKTVILVEQFAQQVLEFADYVAVIRQGTIEAFGEPDDVRGELMGAYLGAMS